VASIPSCRDIIPIEGGQVGKRWRRSVRWSWMSEAQCFASGAWRGRAQQRHFVSGTFPKVWMGTSTRTWQQDDVPGTDACLYHRGKRGSQSDNVLWRLRYALLPRRQGVTRPLRCLGYALSLSHRSPWMAPEVLHDEPSDEKSGFYCYGVLMFPLVTRRYPGIISIKCRLLEL